LNDTPPPIEESAADHPAHHDAIFCPSCAARVADNAVKGQQFRCPVCGTQFEAGSAEGNESAIVRGDLSANAAKPAKRLSTEQLLLDRLTKEPPLKKQTSWTVVALVLAGIIGVSLVIVNQMKKPDKYAPGQQVDSTVLLQKQLFFQHIIDSLQERIVTTPQDIDLHLSLADAYYDAGKWAESRREFVTYLTVHPSDANARVDYAYSIAQGGDLNAAISEIDTALTYQPDHLNALVNAGILTAETINDTNHVVALARARGYFERAKAVAEKTNPQMATKIDTLLIEINNTGERMTQ
jgi:tetratricopeptide (TPR) repeat protein